MPLILDGTLGITTPAESVTGTDVWSVGGSQIYKDAAGNVGIGTSSPAAKLDVVGSAGVFGIKVRGGGNSGFPIASFADVNGNGEMRIDPNGNLLVGTTSTGNLNKIGIVNTGQTDYGIAIKNSNALLDDAIAFINNSNTRVGVIQFTTTATTYATSSDYRLKNTIAPMTGALDKVALLKPCTYKWNADGSGGQGFIAHELAEVEPGCVSGEKDAVDAEGKPQYQGIDTSFLVATLTAAIQELKAIIDTQATRITALEAK